MEVYWLGQTESGVPSGDEWLSEDERVFVGRLRIPKRRADWLLGRWTAKRAIAAYLRIGDDAKSLARIEARPASTGAPEAFVDDKPAKLALSLSHSNGVGYCALSAAGAKLGCDVEKVMPHSRAFLAGYFTDTERDLVAGSPDSLGDAVLALLWSAKESTLKALQRGLRSDTRDVTVVPGDLAAPPAGDEWHPLATATTLDGAFHGWWRRTRDLVWTLVSLPTPPEPIAIAVPDGEHSPVHSNAGEAAMHCSG